MIHFDRILPFVLLFMLQGVVFAQNFRDTLTLQTITVSEKKVLKAFKLTEIDSATTKQAVNLSELLSNNTPVFVKTYGSGSLASVSFRGTGASHTSVLWNGIVLNSPMNGQIDFSLFPTTFIDNAELFHGASGLINGTGALGGSVLLNNNTKFDKGLSLALQQGFGSFQNYLSNAKIAYSTKKWLTETQLHFNTNKNNFTYTNIALREKPEVTQQNAEVKQYGIQQSIFRKFKNNQLGIRFWHFNSDRYLPSNMLANTKSSNEYQLDESYRTMVEWKGFTSKLDYKVISAYLREQLIYNDSSSNIYSSNITDVFDNKLNTTLYLKNNLELRNIVSIRYEQANADGFSKKYTRFNNFWLIGINKQIKQLNLSAFNRMMMVADETQIISPSIGLLYGVTKNNSIKLKANGAINYNYPTFNDLYWSNGGNKNLKPEKAEMIEVGIQHESLIKKVVFSNEITAFYSHVYDWIIWLPTSNNIWSPTNLKEVENRGLEFNSKINYKFNKTHLSFNGNYAYTLSTNLKAKNDNDQSVNKQLIYVPYHQANINVQLGYKEYTLRYNYNYTGKRFISTDNNWYMPANFISNISLNKAININMKTKVNLGIRVNNIFNQEYQAIAWRPMPGRNYLATLSFQFN